jgi:hypothetical protein
MNFDLIVQSLFRNNRRGCPGSFVLFGTPWLEGLPLIRKRIDLAIIGLIRSSNSVSFQLTSGFAPAYGQPISVAKSICSTSFPVSAAIPCYRLEVNLSAGHAIP